MSETNLNGVQISSEVSNKYVITDNSFIATKDTIGDRIVTRIGDPAQPDIFCPKVEYSRWHGKAKMDLQLVCNDPTPPVITTQGNKIKYSKSILTTSFYDLDPQDGMEDGGYEFQLDFSEPPPSNQIQFNINTTGLKFIYQGELTAQEILMGCTRPDDIVGSWAVYYDSPFLNIKGSTLFKTGKFGHIPKPKIYDANGDWTYGDIDINTISGILTVTIPQAWLDSAVYPIRHAAGLSFGYTSIGASTGGNSNGYLLAHPRYMPPITGVLDRIHIYMTNVSGGAKSVAGVYIAPTDYPTAKIDASAEITNTNNAWNVFTLNQQPVSTANYYRSCISLGIGPTSLKYDSGFGSGYKDYYGTYSYVGTLPASYPMGQASETGLQWSNWVEVSLPRKPKMMIF